MTEREKVVKGLECCHEGGRCGYYSGGPTCPYFKKNSKVGACVGRLINDAYALLKEQEENDSEWLEDSDPGQEYGTTWACRACGRSLHMPFIWNPYEVNWKFCPWCGKVMKR